jgi:hypothetical protein
MKNMQTFAKRALASLVAAVVLAPSVVFGQWDKGVTAGSASNLPKTGISAIIANTMKWLLGIFGFLAIIGFVIAGIMYLTAAGDEKKMASAKNAVVYSIYGVVVALLGFIILQAVDTWLNASSTTF